MHYKVKPFKLLDCAVFFDFDNTITVSDVLDDIIKCFAVDRKWIKFEKLWQQGKIGSKKCLEEQLKFVRVTKKNLIDFLGRVKLDPYVHTLFPLLRRKGVEPIILSDSFGFIIDSILKTNGIEGIEVYANNIKFAKDRLIPFFPYSNGCPRCSHCKKEHLLSPRFNNKITVYAGDGFSDICPAEVAHIVFAKDRLLSHLKQEKKPYQPFKNLKDIYNFFQELA